jgi:glutaryl-CoA dehydrogenase
MPDFQAVDFYNLEELLSDEDRRLRDRVRGWVQSRFMPLVQKHYRAGTFPFELAPELGQLGALGGHIQGYGCAGRSPLAYGLVMQELERGDSGLRTFASVQGALAMQAIYAFGSEEQKQRWLPAMARGEKLGCFGLTEPGHGSDPGGMETRATGTAGGYRLSGAKMWIGNGTVADVAVVWAKLVVPASAGSEVAASAAGEPSEGGTTNIRGFLVERGTPGFTASEIEGKLSLRAAITCRLEFNDCQLAADALLPGTRGLRSPLECLNHARYGIAWGVIGSALACFDEARQYAQSREQFGRPIAGFQLVQKKLAEMLAEITKAQLLAHRLSQLKAAGQATPQQISLAKMNNVEMALEVARTARDILGAVGILDDYQCFRHMANLESVRTYEGTHDIHTLILGQKITGISAFS